MTDQPDYILDVEGLLAPADASADATHRSGRRWLGVAFECCAVYARIYKNRAGTAYQGFCPRCGRPVRVPVGPDGTTARFFRAP